MRVAVTGAAGFVGRRAIIDLRAAGLEILPLVRRARAGESDIVVGDLAELSATLQIPRIDACLHLAGRAHVLNDHAEDPLTTYRRVNVEGTRRLLAAVLGAGCRHFVYVSSVKAAGERSKGVPLHPDDSPQPEDPYGVSKAEAEILVRETCEAAGIAWTIVRPPIVYGPGVPANFRRLLRLALSGLPLPLGAARNRRSMVFVGNLADALRAVLTTRESHGRIFYVTDGEDISTADLIRRIAGAGRRPARLVPVPCGVLAFLARLAGKDGEFRRLFDDLQVDVRPTREALGWSPPYTLDEGLALTVAKLREEDGRGGGGPA